MNAQATNKRRLSPILLAAAFLSLASLAWTTWSLIDLLGTGTIGATVAAGADIIWGSVILAEARGTRVAGRSWVVPAIGWAALLVVAGFLALHGHQRDSIAMMAAGPFLPLGAKVVWVIALADMRDPAALTDDEKQRLAEMERLMTFEEAQHRIKMRRREMDAELQMTEVSTDFDIELMRQDKSRELTRRRPLEITASEAPHQTPSSDAARDDALGEAADHTHDAPMLRTVPPTGLELRSAASDVMRPDTMMRLDGMSKAAAVRVMRDADPAATAPQIVQRLAHHGIDASDAYVRTVLHRIKQQRNTTDGGYL